MDPATRQKAGRLAMGLPPGGTNSPADRDSAVVMVVCASDRAPRLSQVAACTGKATQAARAITMADFIWNDPSVQNGSVLRDWVGRSWLEAGAGPTERRDESLTS